MARIVKLFIVSVITASMIAASVNCEKVSGRRLLQIMDAPPQAAESPQLSRVATMPRPGCSLGPMCPRGDTITCENDEETGETGGCVCTLVHLCHPERMNCTLYGNGDATGTPCGNSERLVKPLELEVETSTKKCHKMVQINICTMDDKSMRSLTVKHHCSASSFVGTVGNQQQRFRFRTLTDPGYAQASTTIPLEI